jgi:hypothetical protein
VLKPKNMETLRSPPLNTCISLEPSVSRPPATGRSTGEKLKEVPSAMHTLPLYRGGRCNFPRIKVPVYPQHGKPDACRGRQQVLKCRQQKRTFPAPQQKHVATTHNMQNYMFGRDRPAQGVHPLAKPLSRRAPIYICISFCSGDVGLLSLRVSNHLV